MTSESAKTGLYEQIAAVADGQLTVTAIVEELLEQIEQKDTTVQAWSYLDRNTVLKQATELDRGPALPARGLIFAAKDNYDTHDMPTAYGSPIHTGHQPGRDAASVASLRIAGALLLGKTVTTEFAHVYPGPTRNPWNPEHTPGGSSSGSAAAVASGMVPAALGSQTTGSVIRPAAFCGTVGFKPSYGVINASGMLANAPSFDTIGIFTRSVDDASVMYSLLTGEPITALETAPVKSMRIGFCRTPYWQRADEEARVITEQAADTLARAGAHVTDFEAADVFAGLSELNQQVSGYEFARTVAHERLYAADQLSDDLRDGRMQTGLQTRYAEYIEAQKKFQIARQKLDAAFADIDIIIGLPAPGAAPVGLRRTGDPIFNMPWTTLHTPAMTLPLFRAANGLPIGLQVCARRYHDQHLLRCASGIAELFS